MVTVVTLVIIDWEQVLSLVIEEFTNSLEQFVSSIKLLEPSCTVTPCDDHWYMRAINCVEVKSES